MWVPQEITQIFKPHMLAEVPAQEVKRRVGPLPPCSKVTLKWLATADGSRTDATLISQVKTGEIQGKPRVRTTHYTGAAAGSTKGRKNQEDCSHRKVFRCLCYMAAWRPRSLLHRCHKGRSLTGGSLKAGQVELHVHLDGSFDAGVLFRAAQAHLEAGTASKHIKPQRHGGGCQASRKQIRHAGNASET